MYDYIMSEEVNMNEENGEKPNVNEENGEEVGMFQHINCSNAFHASQVLI